MQVSVKLVGLDRIKSKFMANAKQVEYATMIAVNNVAFRARDAVVDRMRQVFSNPTPWVLGGVRVKKATRTKLSATVDLDFWGNKQGVAVDKILDAEIHGGLRNSKRHEVALTRAGILPEGMRIVPGSAAQLDRHGNMSSGQIVQIIAYFKGFGEQGYKANMGERGKASLARGKKKSGARGFVYFALKKAHGKLLPGIYQRFDFGVGTAVRPVMIFVKRAQYRQRLDFYAVAQRVVERDIDAEFDKALAHALRTAR